MTDPNQPPSRFDKISTPLRLLMGARGQGSSALAARHDVVLLYVRAIRCYLGALLQNEHDADEVAQELVVRLLKSPPAWEPSARGRFRDYLKAATRNAALNHLRTRRRHAAIPVDWEQWPACGPDDPWIEQWRRLIVARAHRRLEDYQRTHSTSVCFTIIETLEQHPDANSAQLSELLRAATGRTWAPAALRQQVHRARRRLAHMIVEEVRDTLHNPTPADVEAELAALGLTRYVHGFMRAANPEPAESKHADPQRPPNR